MLLFSWASPSLFNTIFLINIELKWSSNPIPINRGLAEVTANRSWVIVFKVGGS
jgi:hypothetical protein